MSGLTPENSRIKVTNSLEDRVAAAQSTSEIIAIMHEEAIAQKLVVPDNDPSILNEVAPGTAPRSYAKVVVINGVKHFIEGATEDELVKNELEIMKAVIHRDAVTTTTTEQPRGADGKFITQDEKTVQEQESFRRAELDSLYRTGQITIADYVKRSGVVDEVIAERQQRAQQENAELETYGQTWAEATEEFKNGAGASWPGGQDNLQRIAEVVDTLGLSDKPSADSLAKAYQYMIDNDLLASNPELELQERIRNASSQEELRAILGYKGETREDGRNYWGGR